MQGAFDQVFAFLVSLLPASSGLPAQINTALQTITTSAQNYSYLFPLPTLIQAAILTVAFSVVLLVVRGILFVLQLIATAL